MFDTTVDEDEDDIVEDVNENFCFYKKSITRRYRYFQKDMTKVIVSQQQIKTSIIMKKHKIN